MVAAVVVVDRVLERLELEGGIEQAQGQEWVGLN